MKFRKKCEPWVFLDVYNTQNLLKHENYAKLCEYATDTYSFLEWNTTLHLITV
jgi:hypothetical protein